MKEKILNIIEENICILYETLANFQRMKPAKQDKWNDKYIRECRKDFIQRTREDIEWQLSLRKKLITAE